MVRMNGKFTPVPIPVTSLIVKNEGYAGAITLTASHNGDQWNGIKFETEDGAPAMPKATNAIGSILNEEFRLTEPNYNIAEDSVDALIAKGTIATVDALDYYVNEALKYLGKDSADEKARQRFAKIQDAVRSGRVSLKYSAFYGSAGPVMKKLFEALGLPPADIIETNKPSEGVFVASYEPTMEKLVNLVSAVKTSGRAAAQAGRPTIVLGASADNDAGRFQVNEYNPQTGQVEEYAPAVLTAILGHYLVTSRGLTGESRPWGRSFVSSTYQDYVAKL
jgi:phosphomannomutase